MKKINEKNAILIEKLNKINRNIFYDLIIDNFDEKKLKKYFQKEKKENENFMEKETEIVLEILEGNKDFFRKLINVNNEHIEKSYFNLSKEEYLKEFEKEKIRRIYGNGINPEQMLLYILSTNKMENLFGFFEKEYNKYLEKINKNREKIVENEPNLKEILSESDKIENFEKEILEHIETEYKNVKRRNLEKLEKKYKLKLIKENRSFEVSDKFILFLDEKINETLKMGKKFRTGFEFLNINSQKFSEDEKDFKTVMKEFERVEQENIFLTEECKKLEEKNYELKENIKKYRNKENEKIIEKQKKEIENLKIKIKKLEEVIENIEEDKKVEVIENLKIKEKDENINTLKLKNKNVKVVGGRWSSQIIEKAIKYAEIEEFKIEFIQADEIFRNSEKLKKADIIIFDVSYNSHSAYYKLKSFGIKIFRISTSNLENIKKLNR